MLEGGHGRELARRLVKRDDLHAVAVLLDERAERQPERAAPRRRAARADARLARTHCPVHRVQRPRRLVLVDLLLPLPDPSRAAAADPSATTLIVRSGRHRRVNVFI